MNRFCLIIFISYTLLFSPFNHALAKAAPEEGPSLNKILEVCAEYCERLRHTSFYFVCREEIKETIYRPWFQSEMNKYVYDYQLVRKQGNIKEKRILLSENGHKKSRNQQSLGTKRFTYDHVVFGPIGMVSRVSQTKYYYEVIKKRKFQGEKVTVVRALPINKDQVEHLWGDIWIRNKDLRIVKIEWNQHSIENYDRIKERADHYGYNPLIVLISEYGYEHKDIQFPSQFVLKEIYINKRNGRRFIQSEIKVDYKDYRFFVVKTEIEYNR